ncbi:MAG: class I SAM-dependent RNA methyltransferase [Oscillospiraceae bacterium]|nr:class I SAM-dependent RNA methyltransferase [Oscillospiraceae bacterium]
MINNTDKIVNNVEILGYSSDGQGVARLDDGRVAFVPNAARGDVLDIIITEEKRRIVRAEIVQIKKPSPYRILPDCPVYPRCGGCDYRHITYEEEMRAKLRRVNDALQRIGGTSVRAHEILSTGQINSYRNKAVLHSNGAVCGFYARQSHEIVGIDHCMLLKDDINAVIKESIHGGELALRSGVGAVTLRSGGGAVTLRSGGGGIGADLEEQLDGLVFGISGFFQVNTNAALLLFQKAREYASMSKDETLVDLYCGVGALTLFVGRDAGHAYGIERDPNAVDKACENARRNGLTHIEFIAADAGKWKPGAEKTDCVIVDPPRSGLSIGALRMILDISPKRIVYVSCDPATLARDIGRLAGFSVDEICAVDMFPRTANVECCCLLSASI